MAKTPVKTPAVTKLKVPAKKPTAVKKPAVVKAVAAKPAAKAPAKKPAAKKVKATVMALDLSGVLAGFFKLGQPARNSRLPGSVDPKVRAQLEAEAKRLKISVSALVAAIVTQYITTLNA